MRIHEPSRTAGALKLCHRHRSNSHQSLTSNSVDTLFKHRKRKKPKPRTIDRKWYEISRVYVNQILSISFLIDNCFCLFCGFFIYVKKAQSAKPISSPVPDAWYPTLAVFMLAIGLVVAASFFM